MNTLWQDVRFGVRMLMKTPGFTLVAVAALALGIGANTAIFSVVHKVLLQPLPFAEPARLVGLHSRDERDGTLGEAFSYPNFQDLRAQRQLFEGVAAYSRASAFLVGSEGPEQLRGLVVSADLFPLLGARAALGRVFTTEEDKQGRERVIVLSDALWRQRFNADPKIVGQAITLTSGPATVLGVMPEGFKYPVGEQRVEYYMPLAQSVSPDNFNQRGAVFLSVVARLRAGLTLQQAQAETTRVATQLAAAYPDSNTALGFVLKPLHEDLVGDVRPALYVLLGAVAFVLLIACANVANLLLARAAARQKEIAVRTALGASRGRIVGQLLVESLLLALAGGALGLLLALWGLDLLIAAAPADIPRLHDVKLDPVVLAFTCGVALLTGVVFGLAPAWQASKTDFNDALKEGGRGGTEGLRHNRLRGALVVSEVALSLVLLVGAGLLLQSFWRLLKVDPGFRPERVLAADVLARGKQFAEPAQRAVFFQQVLQRVGQLPGVEAVGAVSPLPLGGNFESYSFRVEGQTYPRGEEPAADFRVISPDYFRTMAIPVKQGRAFNERDTDKAPPVVVINETFARRFFPGENPTGRRLALDDGEDDHAAPREIVGVVGDVRHAGLDQPVTPEMYVPFQQLPPARLSIVTRTTAADPAGVATSVRAAIREVNAEQPVYNVRPVTQLLAQSVARRRFNMLLLGTFAALALVLAALGIYGVMAYSVTRRTHELGIRLALGAQRGDILRLVVGQGMVLVGTGAALGLVAALLGARLMASLLFGVSALDPLTYFGVALLLAAVALVACLIPARRATRVDPMVALRYE
ncbi:MAG TPA: ABC transporter permease [Pyrinomonadaceae bacterium]|jgi:putative ABC transport system permease protein